jgi:hypothetical protein
MHYPSIPKDRKFLVNILPKGLGKNSKAIGH